MEGRRKPGYIPLRDMVRVIRTFRPDVIAQRFQGADRDGHGHHQASGIITKEAFRAAADPKQFPELNLPPWQAKKLYMDNVHDGEDYTVAFDTGVEDPALGMSYVQFAMQGLKHQLSQGAGSWSVDPGSAPHALQADRFRRSAAQTRRTREGFLRWDRYFAAGIGGPARRRREESPWLKPGLEEVAKLIDEATEAEKKDMESAAVPLSEGGTQTPCIRDDGIRFRTCRRRKRLQLISRLVEKIQQVASATALSMSITVRGNYRFATAHKPFVNSAITTLPVDVDVK